MTTLPQTTTVRVPRATGPSALMVPGMGIAQGPVQQASAQMAGADVWRVLRANMMLIICTVATFLLLGVFANYWLAKYYPRYTAVALIEVQPSRNIDLLKPDGPVDKNAIELEQRTQVQRLKHDSLISNVLTRST